MIEGARRPGVRAEGRTSEGHQRKHQCDHHGDSSLEPESRRKPL
jgi:hypothetical protein